MQHVILGFFRDNANDFERVALGLGALGVTIGQGQGKGILGSIHKGRQLVAVGIGFAAPALAFGAVLAAAGILKLIQKLLAHHNGDHILAVIHAAFGPVAVFQLVVQQGHGVRVQAENAPYITGAVAVVFACFYIQVQVRLVIGGDSRNVVDLAEALDGFVIQLDLLPIDVLAAVVVYLNLGQAAHIFEHFVVVMAFRNAHGDHNDNRTDAHNDAHNGQCRAALAAGQVGDSQPDLVRYLHRCLPPAWQVRRPSSFCVPPQRSQLPPRSQQRRLPDRPTGAGRSAGAACHPC